MAGETKHFCVNNNPQDAMIALGNGNILQGIRTAAKIGRSGAGIFNAFMMAGTDTVGVDTLINVLFKVYQPVLVTDIIYKNSASATGQLTGIKVNGELIMPAGWTSTQAGNVEFADLFYGDENSFLFIIPAGAEVEITGIAVNADVVDITIIGVDLTPRAIV